MKSPSLKGLVVVVTLVLGSQCGGSPPTPGAKADAPTEVEAAPSISAAPEPLLQSEETDAATEIQRRLPTFSEFTLVDVATSEWLDAAHSLWFSVAGNCQAVELSGQAPTRVGLVRTCEKKRGRVTTRCERQIDIGKGDLQIGSSSCTTSRPGGAGSVSGSIGGDSSRLGLVSATKSSAVYSDAYRLWVEEETLTISTQACTADSLKRARQERVERGMDSKAIDEALHEQLGIVGQSRQCRSHEGFRLYSRQESETGSWDRGARGRRSDEAVDCTQACPSSPDLEPMRRMNAWLEGKRFVRDQQPALEIYASKEQCMSGAGGKQRMAWDQDCSQAQ